MIYYWVIFSIPVVICLTKIDLFKNINNFLWILFCLLLVFFLGFRYSIGGDWLVYQDNYYFNGEVFTPKSIINLQYLNSDYLFDLTQKGNN